MPFSIQHFREKSSAAKRKRTTNQLCPCKVCGGQKSFSSKVIKRHVEVFGLCENVEDSFEEEGAGFMTSEITSSELSDNSNALDKRCMVDESPLYMSSSDEELQDIKCAKFHHDHNDLELQGNHTERDEPTTASDEFMKDSDLRSDDDVSLSEHDLEISDSGDSLLSSSCNSVIDDDGIHDHEVMNDIYLSEKASLPLYDGSTVTVLQALAGYFSWLTEHPGTSKTALTKILSLNKNILPVPNNLPGSYEEAHAFVKDFLLPTKVYHACRNDCILYRKTGRYDYSKLKNCPVCGAERYKTESASKIPVRKFIYYPLCPRWRRMYGNATISELLQSHGCAKRKDDLMTDVQDSIAWREAFNKDGFSGGDPRGILAQLSTDGVNPFSSNKLSYSMWPIMVSQLNLPRHARTLFGNMMLAGIIPAQEGGGEPKSVDPYLEVLVDEFLEMTCTGANFYDGYLKAPFSFKASLLNYVLDYPGLTKTFSASGPTALQACMWCDLRGISISSLEKVVFLGNRRFLPVEHELREDATGFPGNCKEKDSPPDRTDNVDILWNSVAHSRAANKSQAANIMKATGSKGVNCFMLLPDHDRTKKAFPDLMHALKNVVMAFIDLITGKGDSIKVRKAERELGRFKDCWMTENAQPHMKGSKGKAALPAAPFVLSSEELKIADNRAISVRVPPGYGWRPSQIFTKRTYLKSHDWKQLAVDGILKFCLRGLLGEQQRITMFQLLDFLAEICKDVQDVKNLDQLENDINLICAKIERDFPISIQTISLHILHHVVDGIRMYGPVHSWWMYGYERFNSWICQRVKNRCYPESTVMETYRIFDWVQYMKLSGKMCFPSNENSDDHEETQCPDKKGYSPSAQENAFLRQCGFDPPNLVVRKTFCMKGEAMNDEEYSWCRESDRNKSTISSGSVVTLVTDSTLNIGKILHFISFVSSGTTHNYVTLTVFKNCFLDQETGFHYAHMSTFDTQTVCLQSISGPCVHAVVNEQEEDTMWVLHVLDRER